MIRCKSEAGPSFHQTVYLGCNNLTTIHVDSSMVVFYQRYDGVPSGMAYAAAADHSVVVAARVLSQYVPDLSRVYLIANNKRRSGSLDKGPCNWNHVKHHLPVTPGGGGRGSRFARLHTWVVRLASAESTHPLFFFNGAGGLS